MPRCTDRFRPCSAEGLVIKCSETAGVPMRHRSRSTRNQAIGLLAFWTEKSALTCPTYQSSHRRRSKCVVSQRRSIINRAKRMKTISANHLLANNDQPMHPTHLASQSSSLSSPLKSTSRRNDSESHSSHPFPLPALLPMLPDELGRRRMPLWHLLPVM